jgi:glyoxylase-like metal-dependent hydrolase (beta-lactamase superfamily II)
MSFIHHPMEAPPPEGEALEIAPGILWMRLPLPMALDHVNVYALDDGDGWTLVDTGLNSGRTRALWQRLLAGPLAGRPVRRLIVTHHHPDHVGLSGWFQAQGVELLMTRTAWLYARMLVLDEQALPSPQAMEFYTRAGLTPEMLAQKARERPFNFCDIVAPMPVGFSVLHEGQQIAIGGRDWTIRLGSGHAPDHATFWHPEVILGGDQLLPGISANIGVYPTEPAADPLRDWLESCQRLAAHASDRHLVLPGHKLPFQGLPLRLRQMEENHIGALERLSAHLQTPRLATGCFPALFKREIGPAEFGLALAETVAHLNHLLHQGAVSRDLSPEGAWIWQRA